MPGCNVVLNTSDLFGNGMGNPVFCGVTKMTHTCDRVAVQVCTGAGRQTIRSVVQMTNLNEM